jgi:hypothetical protein
VFSDQSDIVILNDGGEYTAKFAQRVGSGRSKPRRTVEVESEPLLFDFNETQLGMKPAEAIKEVLKASIKAITHVASIATLQRRQRAKRRLEGHPSPKQESYRRRGVDYSGSYEQRYTGGRTGVTMPAQTVRLFNDSGRLADGLHVRQNTTDKSFTINVTANRLDPSEFKAGLFEQMLNRLRTLVPEFQDIRRLLSHPEVVKAINESIADMIMKAESKQRSLLLARARARKAAVEALVRGLASTAL